MLLPASVSLLIKGWKNPFKHHVALPTSPAARGSPAITALRAPHREGIAFVGKSPAHRTIHCIQGLGFWEKQQIKAVPEYISFSRTVVLKTSLKGKSALFEFAGTLKQHNLLLIQLRCQQ